MEQKTELLVLLRQGFEKIAEVHYEIQSELWWHPHHKIMISIIRLGPYFIVKGMKSYAMRSITQEGKMFVRDLQQFHDYLETHFPEIHISFFHFRDVESPFLIQRRVSEMKSNGSGKASETDLRWKEETLDGIRQEFTGKREQFAQTGKLLKLDRNRSSLVNSYLRDKLNRLKGDMEGLRATGRQMEKEIFQNYKLLDEYRKKGAAAAFIFSYSSNLQACEETSFGDVLSSIVKELKDFHRFQIKQKLFGGKLNIYVEEIEHPALAYQMEFGGGALNPNQLAKLGSRYDDLRQRIEEHLMVLPQKDITIDGATKDEKKLFTAREMQIFLQRLDKQQAVSVPKDLPKVGGWIGNVMSGNEITDVPFFHPVKLNHGYVSGTTRSGKTYIGRGIVENALLEGVVVIILDPTMQWTGLVKPATDPNVLERFDRLGIDRAYARGFDVDFYIPGSPNGPELPGNLKGLVKGCSVVSLMYCDDYERCRIVRDVLTAVYKSLEREAENLRCLLVLEEAHLFMPGNVMGKAKEISKEVRVLINRIAREKAKYGCNFLFITQSLSDFKGEAKIIREMINSRFFLRASDRVELEYIENYVSREAKDLVRNLKQGEALVHSYALSTTSGVKVYVRPPFSQVGEFTEKELNDYMGRRPGRVKQQSKYFDQTETNMKTDGLTQREEKALRIVLEYYERNKKPITAILLGNKMGVQGGSRQRIIDGLIHKGTIKTIKIPNTGKGRPIQGLVPLV